MLSKYERLALLECAEGYFTFRCFQDLLDLSVTVRGFDGISLFILELMFLDRFDRSDLLRGSVQIHDLAVCLGHHSI